MTIEERQERRIKIVQYSTGTQMTDLTSLQTEIDSIGTQIRDLKASGGGSGDAIGALVTHLNTLKKQYAEQNGGIGVDGKPYQAPLSKAEKKKLEKEQKAAAAVAAAATAGTGATDAVVRSVYLKCHDLENAELYLIGIACRCNGCCGCCCCMSLSTLTPFRLIDPLGYSCGSIYCSQTTIEKGSQQGGQESSQGRS